jgi:hypothetical protein
MILRLFTMLGITLLLALGFVCALERFNPNPPPLLITAASRGAAIAAAPYQTCEGPHPPAFLIGPKRIA